MVDGGTPSVDVAEISAFRKGGRAARVAGALRRHLMVLLIESLIARGRMPQNAVMLMNINSPAVALSALGTLMENAADLLVRTDPSLCNTADVGWVCGMHALI